MLLRDGVLVKCEIYGEVQVNSHLSGLPDLTLSFANTSILNDVRFHPCVRLRPWESNQILSFVPPDGQFKLMSYRFVVLTSAVASTHDQNLVVLTLCKKYSNLVLTFGMYLYIIELSSIYSL